MKKYLLVFAILVIPFQFLFADTVAEIFADCPAGPCVCSYARQRYAVKAHISQGSAPNGWYPVTYDDGSTANVECINGNCGPDLNVINETLGPPPGQTFTHSITVNGHSYTATATYGQLCYPQGVCGLQVCGVTITIDAQITPRIEHLTNYDDKIGGNLCKADWVPMARYSVHSMLVSLNIEDTPLRYVPSRGPAIDFTVTYNQRETQQPDTFNYSNLGPKWTFNWLSYVTDDPNAPSAETSVYVPGGGAEAYTFDPASQTFSTDPQSHARLVRPNPVNPNIYERRFPDGSKQIFSKCDGATTYPRKIFMTEMVDSAGNSASVEYDSSLRITRIKDALNQKTEVYYELESDPRKITKVADPFGVRFATFEYENDKLKTITDEIGIQSIITYHPGTDSVATLTTPYGTTSFASGGTGTNRWIEITDPLLAKERVEYRDHAPGISPTDGDVPSAAGIVSANLDTANTFFWDKKAMADAPGDYTKARIKHWLYSANGSVSGILSSEKQPLERRVWYTYLGQPDYLHAAASGNPSQVARVLNDGTTQLSQYEYNGVGKMTKATDPVLRVMRYIYDSNQIDLLEIRQTTGTNNELLRQLTYNSLHEPLTDADAAGQVTAYTYNDYGQMLTRTITRNAESETTTYGYTPEGYLASITSPPLNGASAVTSFGYDDFRRIRTVTDESDQQYTVTIDYDHLDRPTQITYPDGTSRLLRYTRYNAQNVDTGVMTLDLTATRDRTDRWTYRHYNANRQIESITDPLVRTTKFEWCACGALESITDPKEKVTRFHRDLQGRVFPEGFR